MHVDIPRLSAKEMLILEMLINQGELYGLEMVKLSDGQLRRGTVYVTLARMAEKGYVESRQAKASGEPGLPRRLFQATPLGQQIYRWCLDGMKMAMTMEIA